MSISFPRTLPASPGFAARRFGLTRGDLVATSPFTGSQQVAELGLAVWTADLTLPPMSMAEGRAWAAWLVSLRGRVGTFLLGDPTHKANAGAVAGSPVVAAGSAGRALRTTGWTGQVLAGDYVQVGADAAARLHMVVATVAGPGAGIATLAIEPALRAIPAAGTALNLVSPRGLFRLARPQAEWNADEIAALGISFAAVEAL